MGMQIPLFRQCMLRNPDWRQVRRPRTALWPGVGGYMKVRRETGPEERR
jgi:hypothetical protein